MHLPDGILSPPVWIAGDIIAAGALTVCAQRASKQLTDRRVPLMGVLGAFVFAAQMINFPVPGGTSGHLMGGVLLAVLLGPASASVVLFCVFLVQALLFQDGGITVLGPNMINMGLVGAFGGWAVFRLIAGKNKSTRMYLGIFVACWASVVVGSLLAAAQLWLSGSAPFGPIMAAMGGVHALIGIGEGLITVMTVRFLANARPELLESRL
jgi:cobalt/nickel transport system permease protein